MTTTEKFEFQSINPFAGQSPFLLFYNVVNGNRFYQVDHYGCISPDPFSATRYELDRYETEIRFLGTPESMPKYVTIPVCIHLPGDGTVPEAYAGNQRIAPNPNCARDFIYQSACSAKKLTRQFFRGGGPCGPVVQIGTDDERGHTIAYFGIDLLFYPQGSARVPRSIDGFTRHAPDHFVSIPRYW